MNTDELRAALIANRERRAQACYAAVLAILAEHNCDIVAIPAIAPDGRIVAKVQIIAKE